MSTVYIVDDDAAVRDGLALLCETRGLSVECHDSGESFLATYRPGQTGCLVLDVRMERMSGPELHAELLRRGCCLAVVYLTGHGDIPLSVRAIKAGATNFLTKPVNSDELLESIHTAFRESARLQQRAEASRRAALRLAGLSEREQGVMALAITGLPNKEIARHLGISHRTVEIHKANLLRKTHCASLLDLAKLAADAGRAVEAGTPPGA